MLHALRGWADFSLLKVWYVLWTVKAPLESESYSNRDKQTLLPRHPSRRWSYFDPVYHSADQDSVRFIMWMWAWNKTFFYSPTSGIQYSLPHMDSLTLARNSKSHSNLPGRWTSNYFLLYNFDYKKKKVTIVWTWNELQVSALKRLVNLSVSQWRES